MYTNNHSSAATKSITKSRKSRPHSTKRLTDQSAKALLFRIRQDASVEIVVPATTNGNHSPLVKRSPSSSPERQNINSITGNSTGDEAPAMVITSPSDVEIAIPLPGNKDDPGDRPQSEQQFLRRSKRKVEEQALGAGGDMSAEDADPLASPIDDQTSARPKRMNAGRNPTKTYYSSSSSIDSYRPPNAGSRSTVDYCQSCQSPIRGGYKHTINLHHHRNPFYSSFALRPHSHSTVDTSNQFTSPAYINGIVSAKPTTAAIPVEDVHLCEVCSTWFRLHRLQCDECYYVPRMDERFFRHCVRCFEGVVGFH